MIRRLLVRSALWLAALAVLLFACAGTIRWPGAWTYLALSGVCGIVMGLWLARHDPALLEQRMRPAIQRDQKTWDKVLIGGFLVLLCAWLGFMAIDVRFHWSRVPLAVQALGAGLVVACFWIVHLTFRANTFAAPVVKIQHDRAHSVVTTGPYRFVRHPMYGGMLLYLVGTPLLLGSWYGLAWVPVLVVLLAIRTVLEERTLREELPGYAGYCARVHDRFVPHVW